MPCLTLVAPSRLHFGLWSLGGSHRRQFGGAGVMIENPSLHLTVEDAESFDAIGPAAERAAMFARRWAEYHHRELPACRLAITHSIPAHMGLGSGTQLALATAAALSALVGLETPSPQELALSVGRGLRSAVGTYGFVMGGFIVEQGKFEDESISPLACRLDLPVEWRFVLCRPLGLAGLAGGEEAMAFDCLPSVTTAITDELMALALNRLSPSAVRSDFTMFAEGVYEYGRLAGECFAARQGGPYNGPVVAQLVANLRARGYVGVGQSSWGPTVFVLVPSRMEADELARWLTAEMPVPLDVRITAPANHGVAVQVTELPERTCR